MRIYVEWLDWPNLIHKLLHITNNKTNVMFKPIDFLFDLCSITNCNLLSHTLS